MTPGLRALLTNVLDYAGLFPPAQLPLGQAWANYLRYLDDPDAWMLGRFVIPAARLAELPRVPALAARRGFTILGRGGDRPRDLLDGFAQDLAAIAAFRDLHEPRTVLDDLELRLPEALIHGGALQPVLMQMSERLAARDLPRLGLFVEIGAAAAREHDLAETLDTLRRINRLLAEDRSVRLAGVGFKLRCGGTSAAAVPSAGVVAGVLRGCRMADVPLKLTAGLHHPLPRDDAALGATMHGFVNLLVADLLMRVHPLPTEVACDLLADAEPTHFEFSGTTVRWKHLTATPALGESGGRGQIVAIGSCSFDEPRGELRALGWM